MQNLKTIILTDAEYELLIACIDDSAMRHFPLKHTITPKHIKRKIFDYRPVTRAIIALGLKIIDQVKKDNQTA